MGLASLEELCPECGQPDNCGDCDHNPLSRDEIERLGGKIIPWTWEEWKRRKASVEEDARVLRAQLDEEQGSADMLRRQGFENLADQMEAVIQFGQNRLDEMEEKFAAIEEPRR